MARKSESGELDTVAELLERSQTKPLLIREELDELLEAHPVKAETTETAGPEPRREEAPPPDHGRRVRPLWLGIGAAAVLGSALVLFLPSHEVEGTAVTPPRAPSAAPTSSDAVTTLSAAAAPTATAGIEHTPVKTTSEPPGAGRKPAGQPPATTPQQPEDYWRDYVSSVISSYEHGPGRHGQR